MKWLYLFWLRARDHKNVTSDQEYGLYIADVVWLIDQTARVTRGFWREFRLYLLQLEKEAE